MAWFSCFVVSTLFVCFVHRGAFLFSLPVTLPSRRRRFGTLKDGASGARCKSFFGLGLEGLILQGWRDFAVLVP
jgi:hypothetical protein